MQMIAKNLITGMRPTTFLFALSKTNCVQAWRFWSQTDPSVHYAFGEFADMDALRQTMSSEGFKFLLADYDRVRGSGGVTRTRHILEKVQHMAR
jgi:hypothetical protein